MPATASDRDEQFTEKVTLVLVIPYDRTEQVAALLREWTNGQIALEDMWTENAINPQPPMRNSTADGAAGWRWAPVALLLLPLRVACRKDPRQQTTIVAGANSPEQRLLTQTVQYLRAKGFRVEDRTNLANPSRAMR